MRTISLVRVPGNGQRDVQVAFGATLQDLASAQDLGDRVLHISGVTVPRDQWASRVLDDVTEVFATAAVKGA